MEDCEKGVLFVEDFMVEIMVKVYCDLDNFDLLIGIDLGELLVICVDFDDIDDYDGW